MATPKIRNDFAILSMTAHGHLIAVGRRCFPMWSSLLIAAPGIFVASLLRGFTGFGFGLAAVPLLSLALPPARVVPLVVLLQVLIGLFDLRPAWQACDKRAIGELMPGLILGVPVGLAILTWMPPNPVRLAIGLVIGFSVLLLWRGAHLPSRPSMALTMGVGAASGTISGLSSMGGPPVVVYLIAKGHDAATVRATSSVYFMLSGLVSGCLMLGKGMLDTELLVWTIVAFPLLFLGSWVGTLGFRATAAKLHRRVALSVLTVLAVTLIVRALGAW